MVQGNQGDLKLKINNVKYNERLVYTSRTLHGKGTKVGPIIIAPEMMPPLCFSYRGVSLGVGKIISRGVHR